MRLPVVLSVLAVIGALCDFFKPIIDLSLAYIALGIFVALFTVLIRYSQQNWFSSEQLSDTRKAGLISSALGIFLLLGSWFYPGESSRGFIANTLSLKDVQNEMISSLGAIKDNTGRTADALEEINLRSLEFELETSLDARKELENIGSAFTYEKFSSAVNRKDEREIILFLKGGMKIREYMFHEILEDNGGYLIDRFRRHPDSVGESSCSFATYQVQVLGTAAERDDNWEFLINACGEDRVREIVKAFDSANLDRQLKFKNDGRFQEILKQCKTQKLNRLYCRNLTSGYYSSKYERTHIDKALKRL